MNHLVTFRPAPYLERWRVSSLRPSLALLVALPCLATLSFGQAKENGDTEEKKSDDEPIVMEVFTVNTSQDVGYIAQSSLSGNRMNTNLKDIAAPTTVFTEEFLRDVAVTNTDDLATYMLSAQSGTVEVENASGQNGVNGDARNLKVRGLPGGTTTVNFFTSDLRFDKFSAERIEQSRGPNAVLFGIGSPGGIVNVTTKRANLRRQGTEITTQLNSYNGLRGEIDFNQPLIQDKLAIRVAAVSDKEDSWRNFEYDDQERFFGTIKLQISPRTELNVEGETGSVDKATKRTYIASDGFTPWIDAMASEGLVGYARFVDNGGSGTANTLVPGDIDTFSQIRVTNAFNSRAAFQRYGLRFQQGGGFSGTGGFGNAGYVVLMHDDVTGTNQLYNAVNQMAAARLFSGAGDERIALFPGQTGMGILPNETVIYGPGFYQTTDYDRISAYLSHTFNEHFSGELAAFRLSSKRNQVDLNAPNNLYINVDIDPTLPGGAANPNVGRPYLEFYPTITDIESENSAVRLSLAYDYDFGSFGHHRLAGVYQFYDNRTSRLRYEELIVDNPYLNSDLTSPINRVYRRTYIGTPIGPAADHNWTLEGAPIVLRDWRLDQISAGSSVLGLAQPGGQTPSIQGPITTQWLLAGTSEDETSDTSDGPDRTLGDSTIFALQSDFLDRRIFTVLGYSLDNIRYHSTAVNVVSLNSLGFSEFLPTASFGIPFLNPVAEDFTADNKSFSLVYHAAPWLSLTYNRGSNTALPRTSGSVVLAEIPPQAQGETQDVGFKLDLFDGRVFFNAVYFDTKVTDDFANIGIKTADYGPMWSAMYFGANNLAKPYGIRTGLTNLKEPKIAPNGSIVLPGEDGYTTAAIYQNPRLTQPLLDAGYPAYATTPQLNSNGMSFDSTATGIELEMVANITDHWRLFANYNRSNLERTNIGTATMEYINLWYRTWAANGLLNLNQTPAETADTVAEKLINLDRKIVTEVIAQNGELAAGSIQSKGNIRTAYDFSRGWLKGVSLGGGVRYQGEPVLAYGVKTKSDLPGADPTDPYYYSPVDESGTVIKFNPTIDDATGLPIGYRDARPTGKHVIMGEDQCFLDLNVGYKRKVNIMGNRKAVWSIQLNVNNVLDNTDVVPIRYSPLSGELVSYRLNPPREWILTTRLKF